jgi:polysaccharide biosynthesis transport protein
MISQSPDTTAATHGRSAREPSSSVLQIAARRKMVLALCTIAGVCAAFGYYRLRPPVFEAKAEVAVQSKRTDLVTGVNNQDTGREDYVAAQMARLHSPVLVDRAVRDGKLKLLPSLAHQPNPTESVLRGLTITRGRSQFGENNLLQLSYQAHYAADCPAVLTALLDAHRHSVSASYEAEAAESLQAIVQARDNVQKQLAKTTADYAAFRKQHPLADKGPNGTSALRQRLDGIQAKRSALLLHRADIEAKDKAVLNAQKAGRPAEILLAMLNTSASNTTPSDVPDRTLVLQEQLAPLLAEEQKLLASYGPKHPDVQAVRARIQAVQVLFARPVPGWTDKDEQQAHPLDAAVAQRLALLQQALREADAADAILGDQEKKFGAQLVNVETKEEAYRADLDRLQQMYETIVKRVQGVRLAKDVGGFDVQVISPPSIPRKIAPNPLLILPAGAFLGLLAGIGLAYRLGSQDDRLLRGEVDQQLALPVLGSVPWFKPLRSADAPLADPLLCTIGRPDSAEAEAFRVVRTALFFGAGKGCQVLQVTSPLHQDGKSLVAANLAVAIARSGKHVVLVDANVRTPRIGPLFGVPSGPGLAGVLAGQCEPRDVMHPSGVPGLTIVASGQVAANPAEILTGTLFADLLQWLREQAEFVIVDSPPMLGSADATMIAPHADGVLLVLRPGRTNRADVERVRQNVSAVGATLIGAVLNGDQATLQRMGTKHWHPRIHEQLPPAAVQTAVRDSATATLNGTE